MPDTDIQEIKKEVPKKRQGDTTTTVPQYDKEPQTIAGLLERIYNEFVSGWVRISLTLAILAVIASLAFYNFAVPFTQSTKQGEQTITNNYYLPATTVTVTFPVTVYSPAPSAPAANPR